MLNLTPNQVRQLMAVIPPRSAFGRRDKAMLAFLLHTGLRVGEVSKLLVSDVYHMNRVRGWLIVHAGLAKGGQERFVPLNDCAQKAVEIILAFNRQRGFSVEASAPLLVSRKHEQLSIRAIQRIVEGYREMAGLDVQATPHSFRHCYATAFVEKSDCATAQKVLGHRLLSSTQRYLHPSPERIEQTAKKLRWSEPEA